MVFEYGGINKDVGTWLVSLSTSISERYTSVTCINILVVLLYVCLAWISYCRSCLTNEWVTEDEWEYMRTLVSGRMGDWRWMRIHEDVGVRKNGDWRWMRIHEDVGVRKNGDWRWMRIHEDVGVRKDGDWRWMRIHEDVGVSKDGWLKMNGNT